MNRRAIILSASVAAIAAVFAPMFAFAEKPEVFTGLVEGVAAGGYDAVSYFSGTPVEGKAEFSTSWKGAMWHFASAENRDAFVASPEKYAPQYGGYCAFAVSNGYTAKGDPEAWSIVDGKLYLNYNNSIRAKWLKDTGGHITAGNANWPKVLE